MKFAITTFLFILPQLQLLQGQISGPASIGFNDTGIYTNPETGTPGLSNYYWVVTGGTELSGTSQTQVNVLWDLAPGGRVEKWISVPSYNVNEMVYYKDIIVENFPSGVEYEYDDSGNRTKRSTIFLNQSDNHKSGKVAEDSVFSSLGDLKVTFFPNPTDGELGVNVEGLNTDLRSALYVYSIGGVLILKLPRVEAVNTIDLSNQPQGTYIVVIEANNSKGRWKVIKQ